MTDKHLSNDEFLTRLTTLLTTTHTSSSSPSIFLSQKLHPSSSPSSSEPQILIRATNGTPKKHKLADPSAKTKLSTLVAVDDVAAFYQRYSEVCKRGMDALRKRDKKKAKAKAKKKGGGKKGAAA